MAHFFLMNCKRLICSVVVICAVMTSGCAGMKGVKKSSTESPSLQLFKEGADLLYVDNAAALKKFDKAHEIDPTFFAASFNAGVALEAMGKLSDAALRYEACLAQNKEQPNCLANLLLVKAKLNEREFAHNLSERYLNEYPESPFAMVAAAELAVYEKDFERAEKFARSAIERDAENVEALYVMARVFYARKEYNAAKLVVKNALELAPAHSGLLLTGGHVAMALENLHDALDFYASSVKHQPTEEALESYGLLLLKRGRPKEALEILQRLVQVRSDEAKNYLHLGNAYLANHQFDDAKASYTKALDLNPEDRDIYFNLGLLFFNIKQNDLPEMDRLKTSATYFTSYLNQTGLSKERIKEVNGYLDIIKQKIELEEYTIQAEKEAAEERAKEEELKAKEGVEEGGEHLNEGNEAPPVHEDTIERDRTESSDTGQKE